MSSTAIPIASASRAKSHLLTTSASVDDRAANDRQWSASSIAAVRLLVGMPGSLASLLQELDEHHPIVVAASEAAPAVMFPNLVVRTTGSSRRPAPLKEFIIVGGQEHEGDHRQDRQAPPSNTF